MDSCVCCMALRSASQYNIASCFCCIALRSACQHNMDDCVCCIALRSASQYSIDSRVCCKASRSASQYEITAMHLYAHKDRRPQHCTYAQKDTQCTRHLLPTADCWCCEAPVECIVKPSVVHPLFAVYSFFGPQADCWCCEAHVECIVETSNVVLLLAMYGFPCLLLRT